MRMYIKQGDTETYTTFASTNPHKTRHLIFSMMEENKSSEFITQMLNDFAHYGWTSELPEHTLGSLIELPPLFGRIEITLYAVGSERMGTWNDTEARKHLRNARKVLKHYGFEKVPHRKLTLADLM